MALASDSTVGVTPSDFVAERAATPAGTEGVPPAATASAVEVTQSELVAERARVALAALVPMTGGEEVAKLTTSSWAHDTVRSNGELVVFAAATDQGRGLGSANYRRAEAAEGGGVNVAECLTALKRQGYSLPRNSEAAADDSPMEAGRFLHLAHVAVAAGVA